MRSLSSGLVATNRLAGNWSRTWHRFWVDYRQCWSNRITSDLPTIHEGLVNSLQPVSVRRGFTGLYQSCESFAPTAQSGHRCRGRL